MLALVATVALAAAPAVSAPVPAPPAAAQATAPAARAALEDAARVALLDPSWLAQDPAMAAADDVSVVAHRLGRRVIARATPIIDGVPVEGADRVLFLAQDRITRARHLAPLAPHGSFDLDEARAIDAACGAVVGCLFTDTTVERLHGFGARVWLARNDGVHAAWKVRVPTLDLRDTRDVYVDAADGHVLLTRPAITFVDAPTAARVFHNDQPSSPDADLSSELEDAQLEELVPNDVGAHLQGFHFETFNCCKHFICNDGSADCLANLPADTLADTVATCAESDTPDANVSTVDLAVPSNILPVQLPGVGDTLFARVAFCAELPRVASRAAAGADPDGWFETPVDKDRSEDDLAGKASEEDAFAEIEVYHSTYVFFQHVRDVLEDDSFCLGPNSMQCDANGDSVVDANGLPVHPFHITTNVLFPQLNLADIGQQIFQGKGASAENPVVISDYQRIPNAAFVPALSGGPINIPPELQVLAALFNRPFDSNIYFQGFRDFAYDGDVVHHEFTHGVVHALNPNLAVNGVDEYGTHVEPGALNEGWADIMSSMFAGNSSVGEYASDQLAPAGETGLRDNNNDKKCPDDLIGEVHGDSEPWAGALWAVHDSLGGDAAKIKAFERAVLTAVAASGDNEDFAAASANLVDAVAAEPLLGQTVADFAQQQLDTRGLSACVRVWPLSTLNADGTDIDVNAKDQLFQPGKGDVGLANYAPALLQMKVQVPPKSGGFTLSWSEQAGGLGLGGGSPAPMSVLVHEITGSEDSHIQWSYEGNGGSQAVPHDENGDEIAFDATDAASQAAIGGADGNGVSAATFTQTLDSGCDARTFIVDIVAPDASAVLSNISVDNVATDLDCSPAETPPPPGADQPCGCRGTDAGSFGALGFALALLAFRKRRR